MKKPLFALLLSACAVSTSFALDSQALAVNLRKTLGLDTRMEIKVDTFTTPSGLGNLNVVNAMIQGSPYPILIDKEGKKFVFGGVVGDTAVDPDVLRQLAIDLKGVHSQGSDKAPVTIVEYSDLQCGFCKSANDMLKDQLYKAYTKDQVRLVFKHFPLSGHVWAETAAVASECAAEQRPSAFWEMNDLFFNNQASVSSGTVKTFALDGAKKLKLKTGAFESCLSSEKPLQKIRNDKQEGLGVGVNSTPSLIINGRMRRGFRDFDDIKVVVDEKLKEAKR